MSTRFGTPSAAQQAQLLGERATPLSGGSAQQRERAGASMQWMQWGVTKFLSRGGRRNILVRAGAWVCACMRI